MRIFTSGMTGFAGSRLGDHLISRGDLAIYQETRHLPPSQVPILVGDKSKFAAQVACAPNSFGEDPRGQTELRRDRVRAGLVESCGEQPFAAAKVMPAVAASDRQKET